MESADQRRRQQDRPGPAGEARRQEEEEELREENLDLTIEDSFPASDPPSTIPDPADGEAQDRHAPADEES